MNIEKIKNHEYKVDDLNNKKSKLEELHEIKKILENITDEDKSLDTPKHGMEGMINGGEMYGNGNSKPTNEHNSILESELAEIRVLLEEEGVFNNKDNEDNNTMKM